MDVSQGKALEVEMGGGRGWIGRQPNTDHEYSYGISSGRQADRQTDRQTREEQSWNFVYDEDDGGE